MRRSYVWSALAGAGLMILLVVWRGFQMDHAFIVGLAAAGLVYSIFRTAEKMRQQ